MDLDIGQLIMYALMGSVSLNTYFMKQELSGLRKENKEERDARNALELKVENIDARCRERHRVDVG